MEVAATYSRVMEAVGALLAELDCLCSLAHVAAVRDWVKPNIAPPGSHQLHFKGLRHPCVEAMLGSKYVPSDISLGCKAMPASALSASCSEGGESEVASSDRVAIITGPNMGKLANLVAISTITLNRCYKFKF